MLEICLVFKLFFSEIAGLYSVAVARTQATCYDYDTTRYKLAWAGDDWFGRNRFVHAIQKYSCRLLSSEKDGLYWAAVACTTFTVIMPQEIGLAGFIVTQVLLQAEIQRVSNVALKTMLHL